MLKYICYIVKHKWLVFIECVKLGIWWRGITHDLSKFNPKEFFAYAKKFTYNQESPKFTYAILHHYQKNDHHWEHWIVPKDGSVLEMPIPAVKEMIADWKALEKQRKVPALEFYLKNRDKIQLAPFPRQYLESALDVNHIVETETVIYSPNKKATR
jgi:hypothetical protein